MISLFLLYLRTKWSRINQTQLMECAYIYNINNCQFKYQLLLMKQIPFQIKLYYIIHIYQLLFVQIFKMNGETYYEKVFQMEFHRVVYIITVKYEPEGLTLQLQEKFTGQLWQSYYEPQYIQQITAKTGSQKKFDTFFKMLINSLTGTDQKLNLDLLTHQDLQSQASRKNSSLIRTTDPKLVNKRYLIISYRTNYESAHYPLPLDYIQSPQPQKLKLTIRRLSQELQCFQSNPKIDSVVKQLSTVRHENQLLKSKIRTVHRGESKQNLNNNSGMRDLQQQNKQLKKQLQISQQTTQQQLKKRQKTLQQKDNKIHQLQSKLKKQQQNNSQYQLYEQKFTKLSQQMNQLVSALQHSKQCQKKSQLKINNLQKQLQKMMNQMKMKEKNHKSNANYLNSPRKSDNGSVRSLNSDKKVDSKTKNKNTSRKNSSVYDSDTESSRMRRNNIGRASPYRQTSKPANGSNSAKKKQNRTNAISKYSNISNLYNKQKQRERNRNRSRSKSRSVKRQTSPPSQNFESSAVMTQGIDFSDNEDPNKQSDVMVRLRNRNKNKVNGLDKQKGKQKQKKNGINPIQERISSIAQMMRKFRNNNNEEVAQE